jgi:membrane protein required for colicin V production
MNWVDILVLVGWGLAALWGFKVGLIRMVLPLAVVVVGLALSSRMAKPVGDFFSFLSENENVQSVAAFIAILIVLLVIGALLSSVLRTAIGIIPLAGLVNNLAGAGVGILIGFIILSGVLTGLQKFPVSGIKENIAESSLGTFMADNFAVVTRGFRLIPGDWNEKAQGLTEGLREKINEFKKDATKAGPVSIN